MYAVKRRVDFVGTPVLTYIRTYMAYSAVQLRSHVNKRKGKFKEKRKKKKGMESP